MLIMFFSLSHFITYRIHNEGSTGLKKLNDQICASGGRGFPQPLREVSVTPTQHPDTQETRSLISLNWSRGFTVFHVLFLSRVFRLGNISFQTSIFYFTLTVRFLLKFLSKFRIFLKFLDKSQNF